MTTVTIFCGTHNISHIINVISKKECLLNQTLILLILLAVAEPLAGSLPGELTGPSAGGPSPGGPLPGGSLPGGPLPGLSIETITSSSFLSSFLFFLTASAVKGMSKSVLCLVFVSFVVARRCVPKSKVAFI